MRLSGSFSDVFTNLTTKYVYHSGPKAIRRYLEFLNDWYAGQSDSLPEESLTKFRNKYEGVSVTWPDKVIHHRPSLL